MPENMLAMTANAGVWRGFDEAFASLGGVPGGEICPIMQGPRVGSKIQKKIRCIAISERSDCFASRSPGSYLSSGLSCRIPS